MIIHHPSFNIYFFPIHREILDDLDIPQEIAGNGTDTPKIIQTLQPTDLSKQEADWVKFRSSAQTIKELRCF